MKGAAKHLRVVLDTNVLISALAFQGMVRKVWGLAQEGRFAVFVSPFILGELERNLNKLGVSRTKISLLLEDVKLTAHVVHPTKTITVIESDKTDNRILECGIEAKADMIVTGNMKHIRPLGTFQGMTIVTPREFLDQIERY